MPDHINIQHPEHNDVESNFYRSRLKIEQQAIELKQLRQWYDSVCGDLTSIFTRIERGDAVELHYKDGSVRVVTGKLREIS